MATDPLAQLFIGEVLLTRYEVIDFVASGGFCLVYQAFDRTEQRMVALKILKPGADADAAVEFETEGELLYRFRASSRILTLLGDAANTDTILIQKHGGAGALPLPVNFLVVELADLSLADVVVARGEVSWASRLGLFRDIVLGVHQMHLDHVAHRDMKSENALVIVAGDKSSHAVVADLGRGRDTRKPARFLSNAYVAGRGDLRFAPPELLHLLGGDDDKCFRRADIFLLGSLLFELATGQGMTALAYGDPWSVMRSAVGTDQPLRAAEYRARLAETRAIFEPTFELASHEFDSSFRYEGNRLLRQLCDPDPARREMRTRGDGAQVGWGLNWLLRRVDILIKLERAGRTSGVVRYRRVVNK